LRAKPSAPAISPGHGRAAIEALTLHVQEAAQWRELFRELPSLTSVRDVSKGKGAPLQR
jgi:hypothetical protein